jgi:hypothetical protein
MIDLNTIISQALAAAVAQATAPLLERIATLESQSAALLSRVTAANARLHERLLVLESPSTQGIGVLLENLDNQEWFWEKIRAFTDGAVEQAVEQHCEEYDHDDMLTSDALPDMEEYINREDLDSEVRDAVREVMEGATVSIRIQGESNE